MKYEVLIVREMFLNEPETARRKKSFIYFIRDMGVLATKEGWRVTGLACVAGGICVRVLYCFCGGVTPAHPASFAGYDKLPDDQTQPTLEMTPGFKPFTARQINHFCILGFLIKRQKSDKHCKLITDVICALCFSAGGARMFSQAMSSLLSLNFPFKVNTPLLTSNAKATEGDEVGRSVGGCFQSRWLG